MLKIMHNYEKVKKADALSMIGMAAIIIGLTGGYFLMKKATGQRARQGVTKAELDSLVEEQPSGKGTGSSEAES